MPTKESQEMTFTNDKDQWTATVSGHGFGYLSKNTNKKLNIKKVKNGYIINKLGNLYVAKDISEVTKLLKELFK